MCDQSEEAAMSAMMENMQKRKENDIKCLYIVLI